MANLDILNIWRRKLEDLERERAITSDPQKIFELKERIKECKSEIEECESKINLPPSPPTPISLDTIYIKRNRLEEKCYEAIINKDPKLLKINAPEKMGKTSLIFNIIKHCQKHNMRVVPLSLRAFDLDNIQELESFLQCFCQEVTQALKLPVSVTDFNDHWRSEGNLSKKKKCQSYFETKILDVDKPPVVLAIDDVEWLAPYPAVCQEFLSMLRYWGDAKTNLIYRNLRLIISYSTEKFIELPPKDSPFNIGVNIEIPEFTKEEVQALADYYELPKDRVNVKEMTDFVVGSPYLMKLAFSYIRNNPNYTFGEFLKFAPTQQGVYKDHLIRLQKIVTKDLQIKLTYKSVVASPKPVFIDSIIGHQLKSLGLIKWEGNKAIPSCKMYRQYFSHYLR